MTDAQFTLLTNLINSIHTQISEKEKIKLARAAHVGRAKEYAPEVYNKIKNTLNQGLFDHLKTPHLDKADYWAEFILEMIWAREKQVDIEASSRYDYWVSWKVQNTHLTLEN